MKRTIILVLSLLCSAALYAQPSGSRSASSVPGLEWYLPFEETAFDAGVPTPAQVLGFEVGERFVEWADVLKYMNALAVSSPRVSVKYWGKTFEQRPFVQIVITSPENQKRLEDIRCRHLALSEDPDLPVVVDLMGSIHGNEASAVNGLMPVAYWYAAATDAATEELLRHTVIVITPGLNPDGINRFATWVNTNASQGHWVDNNTRELLGSAPSGRSNHYWMDCNRDWLSAQFPEGKNCVEMYRYWMPNVVLDLHEQSSGSGGVYYFSPGDPRRTYQYTPQRNQDLTDALSAYTRKALESIGTTYFTKRGYDDFFIGKGAAYCDIQGGVGILHEQLSTRGHVKAFKAHGVNTFPQTVRNQCYATFAVTRGAYELRNELLDYQREFFVNAGKAVASDPVKGYVFNSCGNRGTAYHFIENLRLHGIGVSEVKDRPGTYAVPFTADNYYKVKCIFEDITEYADSVFYDISSWSQARAFNLKYEAVTEMPELDAQIDAPAFPAGTVTGGKSAIGYAFEPSEYYVPYMIAALQQKGIKVRVAPDGFTCNKQTFPAGTIVVPAQEHPSLYEDIEALATESGVDLTALQSTRKKKGFSLSDVSLEDVRNPHTAIVYSSTSTATGAVWYLLDHRYSMPHSLVDFDKMAGVNFNLNRYDVIVLVGTVPSREEAPKVYEKLETWVKEGGTLILQASAHYAAGSIGAPDVKAETGNGVSGIVLSAEKTSESPLLWGYDSESIPVFKSKATVWSLPDGVDPVLSWAPSPYLSGCVSKADLARIAGTPMLTTTKLGKGVIISMQEDFNYRSYWYATSHIFTNAIFFGDLIYR